MSLPESDAIYCSFLQERVGSRCWTEGQNINGENKAPIKPRPPDPGDLSVLDEHPDPGAERPTYPNEGTHEAS